MCIRDSLNPILLGGMVGTLIVVLNLPVVLGALGVGAAVLVGVRIAVLVVGVVLSVVGWRRYRANWRAAGEKPNEKEAALGVESDQPAAV